MSNSNCIVAEELPEHFLALCRSEGERIERLILEEHGRETEAAKVAQTPQEA